MFSPLRAHPRDLKKSVRKCWRNVCFSLFCQLCLRKRLSDLPVAPRVAERLLDKTLWRSFRGNAMQLLRSWLCCVASLTAAVWKILFHLPYCLVASFVQFGVLFTPRLGANWPLKLPHFWGHPRFAYQTSRLKIQLQSRFRQGRASFAFQPFSF